MSFGHEVVLAENGEIAVEAFKDTTPDVILMDIEMPVMNGFEAACRIRAIEATRQWAWTPIIFLTASDTVDNLVTAIEAGGDDFMAKSIPEPVLHAKMKALARIAALRQSLSVANRKLEQLANLDGLTGLCNRRHMDLLVDQGYADAVKTQTSYSLLMLDVDNFKKYNDFYGHQYGDDCLKQVARAIATAVKQAKADGLPKEAFAARYGGEEFAVLLPRAKRSDYERVAALIVEQIRKLAIPHEKNADWGIVTISIGGSRQEAASGDIRLLFRSADQNLYRAKENGRNRVEF